MNGKEALAVEVYYLDKVVPGSMNNMSRSFIIDIFGLHVPYRASYGSLMAVR